MVREQKLKDSIVQIIRKYMEQYPRMEATREPWQREKPLVMGRQEMDYSKAPVFVILYGDTRTQVGLPVMVNYDFQRKQLIYISSLAGAFTYMHLAATTLGLASQWVSSVQGPFVHCLVKELLGIPKELDVYDMIALGYPASEPRGKLMRDKEKMVHYDYCGEADFRTREEVNDFARRTRTWTTANMQRGTD